MIDRNSDWAWIAAYLKMPLAHQTGIVILVVAALAWLTLKGKRELSVSHVLWAVTEGSFVFIFLSAAVFLWNGGDVVMNGRLVSLEEATCAAHDARVSFEELTPNRRTTHCEDNRGPLQGEVVVRGRTVIADTIRNERPEKISTP